MADITNASDIYKEGTLVSGSIIAINLMDFMIPVVQKFHCGVDAFCNMAEPRGDLEHIPLVHWSF